MIHHELSELHEEAVLVLLKADHLRVFLRSFTVSAATLRNHKHRWQRAKDEGEK